MCTAFSLISCLVDLSSITAEWPDVQLRFDVGGGRYLQPRIMPVGSENWITTAAKKRKALVVCEG